MLMTLTACGNSSSWMKGVAFKSTQVNGEQYAELSAQLNTGAVSLIPIAFPIPNPQHPGETLGQLEVKSGLGNGQTELNVKINLSRVVTMPTTGMAHLPNGTDIPVAGVNGSNWIALPVGNGTSTLYLNLDPANKKAVVGVGLNIDQLATGTTANLFLPFNLSNITGVAGIYTGVGAGKSGFALFADGSSLYNGLPTANFAAQASGSTLKIQKKVQQLQQQGAYLKAH
jgi:hypothetical protein